MLRPWMPDLSAQPMSLSACSNTARTRSVIALAMVLLALLLIYAVLLLEARKRLRSAA